MSHIIAAIKSGTDPIAPLPRATFHRTLEEPLYCPKCEATYNLVVDYDWAVSHYFATESRRHFSMLRKTIMIGHTTDHRVTHYESNGVTVVGHTPSKPMELLPMPRRVM